MVILSLVCGILLVLCSWFACESINEKTEGVIGGIAAAVSGIICFILVGANQGYETLPFLAFVIQAISVGVCVFIIFLTWMDENWDCTTVLVTFFIVFFVISSVDSFSTKQEEIQSNIAWDYTNKEVIPVEYEIMGISGESIVVNVWHDGKNILRSIPFKELQIVYTDSVLKPYVYRENHIYTEYDYSKEPPEALRKDSETWTEYILYGSKEQIQELFGYEVILNFEQ